MSDQEAAAVIGPTAERKRHAGERYLPAVTDQSTKRPYSRAVPTLDWLHNNGMLSDEQWRAGDRLRSYMAGMRRPIGLVSSYGDQRWTGTSAGQEIDHTKVNLDWPVYCRQKVIDSGAKVMTDVSVLAWDMILHVIDADQTVEDAAKRIGTSKWTGKRHLERGLDCLAASDAKQIHPGA